MLRDKTNKISLMCPFLSCMVVLYHVNDSRCKGPITQHSSKNSLARNNSRPTDNVRTDRWVDWSTFCPSCWLVTFDCIEMKQIKISMLCSCFSCYQYIASHCVLQNFDLKSWGKCNYNHCLQFMYWNRHRGSHTFGHKIKNIFTFTSQATTF